MPDVTKPPHRFPRSAAKNTSDSIASIKVDNVVDTIESQGIAPKQAWCLPFESMGAGLDLAAAPMHNEKREPETLQTPRKSENTADILRGTQVLLAESPEHGKALRPMSHQSHTKQVDEISAAIKVSTESFAIRKSAEHNPDGCELKRKSEFAAQDFFGFVFADTKEGAASMASGAIADHNTDGCNLTAETELAVQDLFGYVFGDTRDSTASIASNVSTDHHTDDCNFTEDFELAAQEQVLLPKGKDSQGQEARTTLGFSMRDTLSHIQEQSRRIDCLAHRGRQANADEMQRNAEVMGVAIEACNAEAMSAVRLCNEMAELHTRTEQLSSLSSDKYILANTAMQNLIQAADDVEKTAQRAIDKLRACMRIPSCQESRAVSGTLHQLVLASDCCNKAGTEAAAAILHNFKYHHAADLPL